MEWDDSFNDFQETKYIPSRRIITRRKPVKRKNVKRDAENSEVEDITSSQDNSEIPISQVFCDISATQVSGGTVTTQVPENISLAEVFGLSTIEVPGNKASTTEVSGRISITLPEVSGNILPIGVSGNTLLTEVSGNSPTTEISSIISTSEVCGKVSTILPEVSGSVSAALTEVSGSVSTILPENSSNTSTTEVSGRVPTLLTEVSHSVSTTLPEASGDAAITEGFNFLNIQTPHKVKQNDSSDSSNTGNLESTIVKSLENQQPQNSFHNKKGNISSYAASHELPEWLCVICKQLVPITNKNIHFENCMKSYAHRQTTTKNANSSEKLSSYMCDVCKSDITKLTVAERCEHVNRCLDAQTESVTENIHPAAENVSIITECPLCLKDCQTAEARSLHMKKCSQSKGVSVPNIIDALLLQQKHAIERLALGLQIKKRVPAKKPPAKQAKKVIKEPKNQAAADLELAKALSISFHEEEERKEELVPRESFLEELCLQRRNPVLNLRPPADNCRPSRRKKKNVDKPVPLLLLRTDEERVKLFQEKISNILATQFENEDCGWKFIPKESRLWSLSAAMQDKMFYYVEEILEFITPTDIETGSKLRNLSQIPGHRIYTQQPCDFTFSCTPEDEEKVNTSQLSKPCKAPSTQEMIDIIMNENNVKQHITTSESNDQNDGFFCDIIADVAECNPVISSLSTLVGTTWMSDTDIVVSDDSIIPAHSLLLKLQCPVLCTILDDMTDENRVLDWREVTREIAEHFLHFLYTGIRRWPSSLAKDVIELSLKCGLVMNNEKEVKISHEGVQETGKSIEASVLSQITDGLQPASQSYEVTKETRISSQNLIHEMEESMKQEDSGNDEQVTTEDKLSLSVATADKSIEDCLQHSPDLFSHCTDDENDIVDFAQNEIPLGQVEDLNNTIPIEYNVEDPENIISSKLNSNVVDCLADEEVDHGQCITENTLNQTDAKYLCNFDDDTIQIPTSPGMLSHSSDVSERLPFGFLSEFGCNDSLKPSNSMCSTPRSSKVFRKCLSESFIGQSDFVAKEQGNSYGFPVVANQSRKLFNGRDEIALSLHDRSSAMCSNILSDIENINKSEGSNLSVIALSSDDAMMEDFLCSNPRNSQLDVTVIENTKCLNPPLNSSIDIDDVEMVPLHMRLAQKLQKKDDESISKDGSVAKTAKNDADKVAYLNPMNAASEINVFSGNDRNTPAVEHHTPDQRLTIPDLGVRMSDSPVTPLPDYKNMVTPNIKIALKQFGIRALPKKKAIAILNHIYDETHPWVNAPNLHEASSSAATTAPEPDSISKKRKVLSGDTISELQPHEKKSKTKATNSKSSSQKPSQKFSSSDAPATHSSRSDVSSDDVFEEEFEELDEVFSQGTVNCIKTEVFNFIRSDKDLYAKILTYEPINFEEFYQKLKDKGIKTNTSLVMNCLDEECITFSYARSEKYRQKQQARNQRFRKRALAQLSQQQGS